MASTTITNFRSDLKLVPFGQISGVAPIAADTVLVAADSGRTFIVSKAAARAITLPAVTTTGLKFTFISGANGAGIATITAGATIIAGQCYSNNAAACKVTVDDNATAIRFAAASVLGDRIEIVSDGTNWHAVAFSGATDGCVFVA